MYRQPPPSKSEGETGSIGFTVKMNWDDTEAVVTLRSSDVILVEDFAEALYEIADKYVEGSMEDYDGDH